MRYLLLLLLPFSVSAQIDISYAIDTVGGKDSFFLVETISRPIQGSTRPQSTTTSLLFRDTAELGGYIVRLNEERATLSARVAQMQAQLSLLNSRISTITELRDSVMPIIAQRRGMASPAQRSAQGPPTFIAGSGGQVRTEKVPAKKPKKKDEKPPRPAGTKPKKE